MTTRSTTGNQEETGDGVGNIPPAMIRKRALEIAAADGRTGDDLEDSDFSQAGRELRPQYDVPDRNLRNAPPGAEQHTAVRLLRSRIVEAQHDITTGSRLQRRAENTEPGESDS